jgi:hypothetical protein
MASGTLRNTSGVAFLHWDGTTMTYSNQPCGQCHLMDLSAEHTKASSSSASAGCAACHSYPRNTFEDWNATCQQGDCHPTYHSDIAVKHQANYTGDTASCGSVTVDCHAPERHRDLAADHNAAWFGGGIWADLSGYPYGCTLCHTSAAQVPAMPTSCLSCHGEHGPAPLP